MKRVLFFALGLVFITSCKHDPFPQTVDFECDPDSVYFQDSVLPLLISNCSTSGCHDVDTAEDDVILVNYDFVLNTANVIPGDPENSELYESITESDPEDLMPPDPNVPLTDDQIEMIRIWIEQGAKDNSCGNCDPTINTYAAGIKPIIELRCMGCHSGAEPAADFNLITYDDISNISMNGILLDVINHGEGDFLDMPPNGGQIRIVK